jgi:hypothetical protein
VIEEALVARLKALPEVAEHVGDRIFPQLAPDAAGSLYPRLLYERVGTAREKAVSRDARRDRLVTARLHLHVWGGRGQGGYKAAKRAAHALVGVIEDMAGADVGGHRVTFAAVDDESDETESPEYGASDTDPRGVLLAVSVQFHEVFRD